jgi:hypothetical protein
MEAHKTTGHGKAFRSIQKNNNTYSNNRKSQDGSAIASTTTGTGVIGAKLREEQLKNIQKSDVKLP